MIDVIDLRPGTTFMHNDNNIYVVLESQFSKSARSQGHIKVKIKNLRNGSIISDRFTSGEKVKPAYIEKKITQYLYLDQSNYIFMDNEDFQQYEISKDKLEQESKYLKEGQKIDVIFFNNEILGISMPNRVELIITDTEEAVAGNSVNNPQKKAILETGTEVMVPIFINKGEKVIIDTETGKYVSRS